MASQVISEVETTEETSTSTILFHLINAILPMDTGHSQEAHFIQPNYILVDNEASKVLGPRKTISR